MCACFLIHCQGCAPWGEAWALRGVPGRQEVRGRVAHVLPNRWPCQCLGIRQMRLLCNGCVHYAPHTGPIWKMHSHIEAMLVQLLLAMLLLVSLRHLRCLACLAAMQAFKTVSTSLASDQLSVCGVMDILLYSTLWILLINLMHFAIAFQAASDSAGVCSWSTWWGWIEHPRPMGQATARPHLWSKPKPRPQGPHCPRPHRPL